jgi:acetyl coenzyme A synthetase (ADP forming)-like protein
MVSDLNVFFRPHGVAVIGASRDPNKLGYGVVRNLLEHGYEGPVYPINPHADEILGLKVYENIADVPDPVDLAIIVVPASLVERMLEACGKRGIGAVTVVSGGFREVGPEGEAREERIKTIAREYDIRLLGPNCIGTIDTHTPLNSTFVTGSPIPGEIALVSQSGAVTAALIDWARGSGVGFSRMVSLGNQAGVTEAEMLEAVAQDERTRVILAYIEGVADGRAFLEAATRVSRHTPVIALKVGRGGSGARAVASHTGALAGADAAYDAAFRRAGVLRAGRLEEMLDWARALAWQPLPQGNRVAILTNAGGAGVMALDALEAEGMRLAPVTEDTKAFLKRRLLPAASVENPVDILAGSGPATYALCLDALLDDETVDAVVVITAPQDWFEPVSLAEVVGEVGNSPLGRRKPVLGGIMGLASTSDATHVLHRRNIPNYAFPERVGSTLCAMWERKRWLDELDGEPPVNGVEGVDGDTAEDVIRAGLHVMRDRITQEDADPDEAGWMSPDQVEALLNAYGIQTPQSGLAPNVDAALELAKSVKYPVALKLAAPSVTHKSDVGGVVLNIDSAAALRQGFSDLMDSVSKHMPDLSVVEGIYVQHMIDGTGELIVGAVRDPQFGPLVMAGVGGTAVELKRDVAFELAPLSRKQADAMLDRTAAGALLGGFRGAPPADREAVVDAILCLAQIALDWDAVAEIEINPLIVLPRSYGAYAVDARVRLEAEEE